MDTKQSPRPVILDTDIGSDVDDLLALVLLARAPEVRLIGVTTVYGDTTLRARIARLVLDRLKRFDVEIGIGARETLTGRPVWWAGHEGAGIAGLAQAAVEGSPSAVELLRRVAAAHAGQLELVAIGPLTNVAAAIVADYAFAPAVRHLSVMGGAFWTERAEHNFRCDPEAAAIVLRSGIPMTICGLDVTEQVVLRERDLPRIREAADGIGPLLEDQIRRWWAFKGVGQNFLHDPLAVLAALRPDLFRFERSDVRVEVGGPHSGRAVVERRGAGALRVAAAVDAASAEAEIVHRIRG